jgi:hypothetical protein
VNSRPTLYVAITNHGFGHATRTVGIVAEIQRQLPDLLPILVTTAPRWLLDCYIDGDFIHRPRALDVGVIQSDSLTMDLGATLAELQAIRARQQELIGAEVSFIEQTRVDLVLADIPPLAAKIAKAAHLPCWMVGNFGWDFIYRAWGHEFNEIADWMAEGFAAADRLFRLPFHEPMSQFPVIEDVGLASATPHFSAQQLQETLGISTPPERTVLLTFGGLGVDAVPYQNLQRFPDWQFLTTDRQAPTDVPNLLNVCGNSYRPVDLMPCCGQIISKPGFSTFAEALQLGLSIVTVTRSGFAETELLLNGLRDYGHHRILSNSEFFESNWDFLATPFTPPRKSEPILQGGKQTIASAAVDYFANRGYLQPTNSDAQREHLDSEAFGCKTLVSQG